ncbi:16S ribosomal RNA methyltransferase RsmE [Staphylococcus gallinarum]|uniref:16S ribosomal RNA methyltransferase RsmE n=1 Tax=Staphylococcus gallinarum TaxID=1293 RepID=A0A380FGK0_STAGA|nr:16S ribosomal RNA methyltransferase RsmE [Staphylococcus gallinarum]
MQRYFINQNADENQRFFIEDKGDIHHIANVMRHPRRQSYNCDI